MNCTILFVDDDPHIISSWKRAFMEKPFTSLFASTGKEALELVSSNSIDILVTDYKMPHITGLDLCRHIENTYPQIIRVMISGNASLEIASDAINSGGISLLLNKPYPIIDLESQIQNLIQNKLNKKKQSPLLRHTSDGFLYNEDD